MNYETMVNLIHASVPAMGHMWVQFDADGLPFFRIAWRAGPWGPWIGWN